ncbi:MAG: signal peptide peptidase SppA [Verrucomicrobia bacterium]|nr:signal peptide peptidase SppA [Verrucomicrobiota bacterium]
MKSFFASFFGTIAGLCFLVGAGIILLILVVAVLVVSEKPAAIQNRTVLVLDLSDPITDAPLRLDTSGLVDALTGGEEKRVTLRDTLRAISAASKDNRISGILITGNAFPVDYSSGYPALREVRNALVNFKTSKKPIYAYLVAPSTRTFYLASVADNLYLDPEDPMLVQGLSTGQLYYADAFQKYGIEVQVSRVGKYKSAVEPFILDKMSPESREQTEALLGDLWHDITTDIEQARHLDPGTLQKLLSQSGLIDGETARREKLVTGLKSLTDLMEELKTRYSADTANNTFRQISVQKYVAALDQNQGATTEKGPKIAIVYAEGVIVDGEGSTSNVGGDKLAREIRKFRLDPEIKAIVLRINSPGGSGAASEVIWRELAAARKAKPVVVSMGTLAASGGYYIATASNRIFAEPTTITGSIGVFGLFPNVQKLFTNIGITWDSVSTTPYSNLITPFREKTPDEMSVIQKYIDQFYQEFLQRVSAGRNIPVNEVNEIAQGRVWSGDEALKLRLVDQIGGLASAVAYAAELTHLGEQPRVIEYPAKRNLGEAIQKALSGTERPPVSKVDPVNRQLQFLEASLRKFADFNDPLGVYALLPFGIEWN